VSRLTRASVTGSLKTSKKGENPARDCRRGHCFRSPRPRELVPDRLAQKWAMGVCRTVSAIQKEPFATDAKADEADRSVLLGARFSELEPGSEAPEILRAAPE
jgi:hypothetical protein